MAIDPKREADQLLQLLSTLKPKAVPASGAIRQWWDTEALPTLRAQALSELHRRDEFAPRLIGFMKGGELGIIDVAKATEGRWGSSRSKNVTAFVHKIAALVPGTIASVFCTEAWSLHANSKGEIDRQLEKYPSLGDHPDRYETMMFNMMHYDIEDNTMMQLVTMIEILKVLGHPRHPMMWAGTKLSDEVKTTDPLFGEGRMEGRFIYRDDPC